jgi:uncharacterized protein (TIRG00374 family)
MQILSFKTLGRVALSLSILVLLFKYVIDPRTVWRTLEHLDARYFVLAFGIFTIDRVLMAYKWNLLIRARSYRLSVIRAVEIYSSAMFLGTLLPSTLGADVIRTVLARRAGIGTGDVVASIAVERSIGFICALMLALVGLIALRLTAKLDERYDILLMIGIVGLFLGIATLLLSFHPRTAAWMAKFVPAHIRSTRFAGKVGNLVGCYQALGASRSVLISFVALTCVEQLIPVVFTWVNALSFGLHVSPVVMLGAVPLSVLVARLPISISGLGAFEGTFAGLLSLSGISPRYAIAIAFVGRAIETLACVPWWLLYQLRKHTVGEEATEARAPL